MILSGLGTSAFSCFSISTNEIAFKGRRVVDEEETDNEALLPLSAIEAWEKRVCSVLGVEEDRSVEI